MCVGFELLTCPQPSARTDLDNSVAAGPFAEFATRPIQNSKNSLNSDVFVGTNGTGGESGIRTHGRVSPTHAFQACSFNHSDISPCL